MVTYEPIYIHHNIGRQRTLPHPLYRRRQLIQHGFGAKPGRAGSQPHTGIHAGGKRSLLHAEHDCLQGGAKGFATKGICVSAGVEHDAHGISALLFDIHVPMPQTEESRRIMESCVKSCPVGKAISESVEKRITWHWTTWMD